MPVRACLCAGAQRTGSELELGGQVCVCLRARGRRAPGAVVAAELELGGRAGGQEGELAAAEGPLVDVVGALPRAKK